jgi:hypothetical protein
VENGSTAAQSTVKPIQAWLKDGRERLGLNSSTFVGMVPKIDLSGLLIVEYHALGQEND